MPKVLPEHELDHVLVTISEEIPNMNPEEVSACKWMSFEDIQKDLKKNPEAYTYWFGLICEDDRFKSYIQNL